MAKKLTKQESKPTQEEIAQRAYEIFVQRGRPQGHDLEHWLEAEAELVASRQCSTEQVTEQKSANIRIPTKTLARQQFSRS